MSLQLPGDVSQLNLILPHVTKHRGMNKMNKNTVAVLLLLMPFTALMALQPLDDQALSTTTGQDGINVGITLAKVDIGQLALIDKDGVSSQIINQNFNQAASLSVAGVANAPISMRFVGANTSPTVNAVIDTDAGNGSAFANIALSLGSQISAIKVSPFALYLANTNSNAGLNKSKDVFTGAGVLNQGVTKLIEIGNASNNFEIGFVAGNAPKVNIQLGGVPQNQMMKFSGAIQSICGTGSGCPMAIISGDSSARFDFQAKGNTAAGIRLDGFYAGIEATGLVFGNTATSTKMDVALNNLMLGNDAAISSNLFNGLPNGSMGSFGAVGASVKDLKVNIRGL